MRQAARWLIGVVLLALGYAAWRFLGLWVAFAVMYGPWALSFTILWLWEALYGAFAWARVPGGAAARVAGLALTPLPFDLWWWLEDWRARGEWSPRSLIPLLAFASGAVALTLWRRRRAASTG